MNKIYYLAKQNRFYFSNVNIHSIPVVAIDVTDKYQEYRALELQGYTREAGENGLPVYTAPNFTIDTKQVAKQLLDKTHCFETPTHKELLFTGDEYAEFENWRRELIGVIIEGNELPPTPPFITSLMENYNGN